MKILFIGSQQLQNLSILEILESEKDLIVDHILPIQIEEEEDENYESHLQRYDVSLIDITSFANRPDECVRMIKEYGFSDFLVALHTYSGDKLTEPILQAGADRYLSLDSVGEELLDLLRDLDEG